MASSEERLVFEIFARDRGASRTFDQVGRSADRAGDDIEGMGKQSKALDKQIDETSKHLRGLIEEFSETNDKELFKEIRRDRSTISMLQRMRKEIHDLGAEANRVEDKVEGVVGGVGAGLKTSTGGIGSVLGAIPSQLKGLGIVTVAGLLPFLLPSLGAAVGGAVLGGVGTGGIVGGIALATQDDRVKQAGSRLGQTLFADLQSSANPFIQPLLRSFGELEETGEGFIATLHNGFTKLAPIIGPLTKGVDGLVGGIGRGLDSIFDGPAQTALRALANELPEIGDAIGDMFASISDGSDGATMGFIELLHIIEDATRFTGEFIEVMSDLFEWEVKTGYGATAWADNWLSGLEKVTRFTGALNIVTDQYKGVLEDLNNEDASLIAGLHDANRVSNDWRGSLRDLRDTTEEMTARLANFNDEIDKYLGKTLGVEEAQIRLKKQWADTVDTLREGKRTLDINTEAGQDNKQALIDLIQAAEAVRDAEFRKTGSLDAANRAYDEQLEKLRDTAVKLHFNKTQVDALIESVKTGNAIGGLTVPVTMPGLDRYMARLNYYMQQLGAIKGLAATEFATYREGERNPNKRAAAGPLLAGNTYLVGDNGPELLHMGVNATMSNAAGARSAMSAAPVVINFPGPTGDPIFDAVLRKMREGVSVEGGGSVAVYFGGVAA